MIQSKKTYALLLVLPSLMCGSEASQKKSFPWDKAHQGTGRLFASVTGAMRTQELLANQQVQEPKTIEDVVKSGALQSCVCKRCAKPTPKL